MQYVTMKPRLKKYTYAEYCFGIARLNASGVLQKKKQLDGTPDVMDP